MKHDPSNLHAILGGPPIARTFSLPVSPIISLPILLSNGQIPRATRPTQYYKSPSHLPLSFAPKHHSYSFFGFFPLFFSPFDPSFLQGIMNRTLVFVFLLLASATLCVMADSKAPTSSPTESKNSTSAPATAPSKAPTSSAEEASAPSATDDDENDTPSEDVPGESPAPSPSKAHASSPSKSPASSPSKSPASSPSKSPTSSPSKAPSLAPSTKTPMASPKNAPSSASPDLAPSPSDEDDIPNDSDSTSPAPSTVADVSGIPGTPQGSPAASPEDFIDDSGAISLTSKAAIGGIVVALMAIAVV